MTIILPWVWSKPVIQFPIPIPFFFCQRWKRLGTRVASARDKNGTTSNQKLACIARSGTNMTQSQTSVNESQPTNSPVVWESFLEAQHFFEGRPGPYGAPERPSQWQLPSLTVSFLQGLWCHCQPHFPAALEPALWKPFWRLSCALTRLYLCWQVPATRTWFHMSRCQVFLVVQPP